MSKYTSRIIGRFKGLNDIGKCYYPEGIDTCQKECIKAHSIQCSGLLKNIEIDEHVYGFDLRYGSTVKRGAEIEFIPVSIRKISTFKGFCHFHDSNLFSPIDNSGFDRTRKQAFLYAYRALCKNLFSTRNSLEMAKEYIRLYGKTALSEANFQAQEINFISLNYHKELLDLCIIKNNYEDISYIAFVMDSDPNILFSSCSLPYYDFNGKSIQTSIGNRVPSLIAFNSVPYKGKWLYMFTWHVYSGDEVDLLLESLADIDKDKNYIDFLFRFIITSENLAISPKWWNTLRERDKFKIKEYINNHVSPSESVLPDYLSRGLEGIINWESSKILYDNDTRSS